MNNYKVYLTHTTAGWGMWVPEKIVDINNREVIDLEEFIEGIQCYISEKMSNSSIYDCSFYFDADMTGIDLRIDYDTGIVSDTDVDTINDILFYDYKIKCVVKE